MKSTPIERITLGVIALGFTIGAVVHVSDYWFYGWAPYRFGPAGLNLFWNALATLDIAVVALLLLRLRRTALVLALLVMIGDVTANSYAWVMLDIADFAPALIAQTGFLGFLLGSAGFLWRRAPVASPALPLFGAAD